MLSLYTQHDILDFVIIMFTGILPCYYGTKCHTILGGGHLLNLLAIPVMSSYSRNLIIMLISHKRDNLYGEWEEVMDAGMIPCL